MKMKKFLYKNIPSILSILRMILAFIFLFSFLNDQLALSIIIFLSAIFTDITDGYLARRFNTDTSFGAYLDVTADFILILLAFISFAFKEIYPSWIILLIILVFAQFIITSRFKMLVYDPLGKYYGAFLFIIILLTLISPIFLYSFLFIITVLFTFISIISRYIFFILKNKK